MTYRSPVADILFSLQAVAGLPEMIGSNLHGDFDWETISSVVEEAGRFATDEIAPLNQSGDVAGARYENGVVTMPGGFGEVYRRWAEGGWGGVSAPPEFGGMGLPHLVNVACTEIWNGASMAFALCPLLTEGAIGALKAHGSRHLVDTYLAAMISGRWTGTMNLTEPQAGSDLNAVKTRAERAGDGTYRLFGQKIFITYGEHDMAENIVHLVLARLPGAPAGTRGLSLFVAPKYLVNPDGSLGPRNDLRCASIEHKLGIHASPTCVMLYGESEGANAWLVGEENRGLAAMFVMMNAARLAVGTQGVAIGERAYQRALAFARDRRQGRGLNGGDGMAPIIEHADVQRMLMTMKAYVHAARGICHLTAASLDLASHGRTEAERAAGADRAALLTPIAKAFSTDIGDEAASLGVQIHGGMGFIEETGAAQLMRDFSHRRDLRRRQRHTRHRPGSTQTVSRRRRNGQERNRRNSRGRAGRRRLGRRSIRRDGRAPCGGDGGARPGDAQYASMAHGRAAFCACGGFAISSPVRPDARRRLPGESRLGRGGACVGWQSERTWARRPCPFLRRKAASGRARYRERDRLRRGAASGL